MADLAGEVKVAVNPDMTKTNAMLIRMSHLLEALSASMSDQAQQIQEFVNEIETEEKSCDSEPS